MNPHDGGTSLPLIKEIAPLKQQIFSPKNREGSTSPRAYYLDINKFLPSLKLFKQNSSSSGILQNKKSSYFSSFEKQKTPKKSYLLSPKKRETQINLPKNNEKIDAVSQNMTQSERSEYYLPLKTLEIAGSSSEYMKKLKKIDKISSQLLPLSKESFYDEYHMKLYELSLMSSKKTEPKKQEPLLLQENTRAQIEGIDKSAHYFYIKTEYNGLPIKINVNSHKGNYVCCVNFRELAKLESHDYIFNSTSFIIESESLYMFDKIFLTIIAIKDFKISVSYSFVNNEIDEVHETSIRKNSQPNEEALLLSTTSLEKNRDGALKIADDEFYKDCEKKKQNLVFRNKHIAKNYLTLKKAVYYKNQEEMIIKKNKAIYNNDKFFFQDLNEKLIKYYKKRTKILEVLALEKEQIAKKNYNFFLIEWLKLLQIVKFIDFSRERYKLNKTLKRFLAYKELMANKIQRLFRRAINKSKIRLYNKRMHLNIFQSLCLHSKLLKKKVKCNAKKTIASFLKEAKRPMNIFLHMFKTLMKIVFMKNKMKLLRKSNLQRILHLNRVWDEEIQKMMKTKNESIIYYIDKLANSDKENALKEHLNKKKMEYFYQIQEFLNKKATIGKKRTLAMRFIESVQEKETSYEDIELTEMTKESLLYRSLSPKSQTKIFKEKPKDFHLNVNKADSTYQRKDSKALTLAHIQTHVNIPTTFGNAMKINNNLTFESINNIKNEAPDSHSFLDKPIFKYLPTAEEMKEIIMKAIGEVKKRQLVEK